MVKHKTEVEEISIMDKLKAEVERNPRDLNNHLRLGWILYGEDRVDEAIEIFQGAQDRFPKDIEVLYALALAYKKTGKGQEALRTFQGVIKSAEVLDDKTRAAMLRRLAIGHTNVLERGDWDLKDEIWEWK